MAGVFINYRVVDQPLGAAAIDFALASRFGRGRVFRDCVSMRPGENYPSEMREALRRADVLVVIIGPDWTNLRDNKTDQRLIDRERDWVRWEIAEALRLDIEVVPVLLRDIPTPDGTKSASAPKLTELPEKIQGLGKKQVAEVSHRRLGEDLERLADRLIQLVPTLAIVDLFDPPPPPRDSDNAPSALLLPVYEIVPFTGRTEELADLRSWATGAAACSAMLVVGPDGSGKTRLAQALCGQLLAEKWLAGIVRARASASQIGRTSQVDRPVLAVVDNAEVRADQMVALAAALGERSAVRDAPARLLMLARSNGDWLSELQANRDERVAELFRRIGRPVITLGAGIPDRDEQVRAAHEAFAKALGVAETADRMSPSFDYGESLLDLHAAVLDSLLTNPSGSVRPHPLDRLMYADRRHWRRLVRAHGQGHLKTAGLATVGTLATLCRPASEEEADALRRRLSNFLGEDADQVDEYVAWLRRLYPGPHLLNPVRPDALGERMVAATLAAEPSIAVTLAAICTPEQITHALTVMGRALPRHPQLARAIADLVRVDPQRLVLIGVDVAASLAQPEPFSRALAAAVGENGLTADDVFALFQRFQKSGHGLDALKAALLRTFRAVFAEPIIKEFYQHGGISDSSGMKPLQEMGDKLTDFVLDAFTGVLDPGSGRLPRRPDGQPIVPPLLLDVARKLMIARDWFPPDRRRDRED